MKKILWLLLCLICKNFAASAQGCGDFLGTKTLYQAPAEKNTSVPAGYLPVFINHVGRHGARHLTKDVESYFAYQLLFAADSTGWLSADGHKLKQMVLALQKAENGNTKSISVEGQLELEGIGERIYENNRNVFDTNPDFNIRTTKEIRTRQSANAFMLGLNKKLPHPASPEYHNDDTDLRFYDLSPAYKKFENEVDTNEPKVSFDKQLQIDQISSIFTARFFKPDFFNKLNTRQKVKFASDIFGFATIVYSIQAEINKAGMNMPDVDFKSFFSCDQLKGFSTSDSADEYLKKGPGTDNNGIQVRVAVPLLVDFIKTTDQFIASGKLNVQLRFAHAETIAPFAALLQIAGADGASNNISTIEKIWQSSEVIPLSSNIQWVFYKKQGSDEYLVKILLNEKKVRISGLVADKNLPYYHWKDMRAFYIKKLTLLNVGLTDDMNKYLTDLK